VCRDFPPVLIEKEAISFDDHCGIATGIALIASLQVD
jgi:hypothetical protein